MHLTFLQMKSKKTAKSAAGTESELELGHTSGEEASGSESRLESNSNVQTEEPTAEQKGGEEELPQGETASATVSKNHAMLQDEQDRPHYNPDQGGHTSGVQSSLSLGTLAYVQ